MLPRLTVDVKEDGWFPPRPDVSATVPLRNPLNILLNDVENELAVILNLQPDNERHMAKVHVPLQPAMAEFERILGSKGCRTFHPPFEFVADDN